MSRTRLLPSTLLLLAALAPGGCNVPVYQPLVVPSPSMAPGVTPVPVLPQNGRNNPNNQLPGASGQLRNAGATDTTMNIGETDRALASLFLTDKGLIPTTGVVWTSSADAIVQVNPTSGLARALGKGTAVITVALQDDPSVKAQVTINVTDAKGVQNIQITPPQSTLAIGESADLRAEVRLGTGEIKSNVTWSSSDDKIARVDASGKVTAVAVGTAQILATFMDDPNFKGQGAVRVVATKETNQPAATPTPGPKASDDGPGTVALRDPGTWVDQVNPLTNSSLSYVKFFDLKNGVAAGQGAFLSTNDSGKTWVSKTGAALAAATKFDFQGPNDGWVLTQDVLYFTPDGASYQPLLDAKTQFSTGINDFQRVGKAEGYVLLNSGALYKTVDAGVTWTAVSTLTGPTATATTSPEAFGLLTYNFQSNVYYGPLAVVGANIHYGYAFDVTCKVGSGTYAHYSTCSTLKSYSFMDGAWKETVPTYRVSKYYFRTAKEGWRLLNQAGLQRTVDGGNNWLNVELNSTTGERVSGVPTFVEFFDDKNGFVGTTAGYWSTADNGRTWLGNPLEKMACSAMSVVDLDNMWMVGSDGKIKRYVVIK
jgi:photosystem II stability/assembly factor-like uncharacterized protein